jgi:GNAT superfamily N-acetyltransferase
MIVMRIRRAVPADAPIVGRQRARMYEDMGELEGGTVEALAAASAADVAGLLARGEYFGWLAEEDGRIVAGVGAMWRRLLPRGRDLGLRREAYVLNVFTEPAYRGRGIAHALMEELIAWARAEGAARIVLHASDQGRPVYEGLGFEPTNEMRLK